MFSKMILGEKNVIYMYLVRLFYFNGYDMVFVIVEFVGLGIFFIDLF